MAELNVPYILMHMRGDPKTMQRLTDYTDTCLEVGQELQAQAEAAMAAGIEPWRIILDPGAGTLSCAHHKPCTAGTTQLQTLVALLYGIPYLTCTCSEGLVALIAPKLMGEGLPVRTRVMLNQVHINLLRATLTVKITIRLVIALHYAQSVPSPLHARDQVSLSRCSAAAGSVLVLPEAVVALVL